MASLFKRSNDSSTKPTHYPEFALKRLDDVIMTAMGRIRSPIARHPIINAC